MATRPTKERFPFVPNDQTVSREIRELLEQFREAMIELQDKDYLD